MPQVQMPDGNTVDMPDTLTPDLGQRLRAFNASAPPPGPPSSGPHVAGSEPVDASPAGASPVESTWHRLFSPAAIWQGIKDNLQYAKGVATRTSADLGNVMAAVTGDSDWQFKNNSPSGLPSPQETDEAGAKLSAPARFLTDIVANPLTYLAPELLEGQAASNGVVSAATLWGSKRLARYGASTALGNMFSTLDPNATPGSVALGTGIGAMAGPVVEGVANLPGAIGNTLRRVLGTPEARAAALAKAEQVRTATASPSFPQGAEPSLGESIGSPLLKHVENATEYVPLAGRGSDLASNNSALQAAVGDRADALKSALGPTGVGDVLSDSAAAGLAEKRAPAVALYDEVRAAVKGHESTPTFQPVKEATLGAFDDAISKESGISGSNSPQTMVLKAERANLADGETGRTWEELEAIQDRNQSQAANGFNAADQTQQDLARYRSKIGQAVGQDLQSTADQISPELGAKYKEANRIYSKSYDFDPNAPLDSQNVKMRAANRILAGQDGFKTATSDNLFRGDSPDMAAHADKALDQTGHDAVKAEIWNRIDNAGKTVADGGKSKSQVFSPNASASAIDAHANFIKQFFDPEEQTKIFALRDAMRTLGRSGQYMEQLHTGKFNSAMAATGGIPTGVALALTGHPALLASEGATMTASKLYNLLSGSAAGKAWLLKAPNAAVNVPMPFQKLLGPLAAQMGANRPQSQDEYDALKSGSPYIAQDGTAGVKP